MDGLARRRDRLREQRTSRDDERIVAKAEHLTVDDDGRDGLGEQSRAVREVSFDERDLDDTKIAEQNILVEHLEAALDKIVARQRMRAQALGFLLRKTLPAAAASDPAVLETLKKLQRVFRRKS
jgi:hypothetical protein